jgi:transposase-like protein
MSQKKYSKEFKEEAVRLMMIDGLTTPEVSAKLDVKTGCLYFWKSKLGKRIASHNNDIELLSDSLFINSTNSLILPYENYSFLSI